MKIWKKKSFKISSKSCINRISSTYSGMGVFHVKKYDVKIQLDMSELNARLLPVENNQVQSLLDMIQPDWFLAECLLRWFFKYISNTF